MSLHEVLSAGHGGSSIVIRGSRWRSPLEPARFTSGYGCPSANGPSWSPKLTRLVSGARAHAGRGACFNLACVGIAEIRLEHESYLPIRTAFETEPLANVLWTLAGVPVDDELILQILIRPRSPRWQSMRSVRRSACAMGVAVGSRLSSAFPRRSRRTTSRRRARKAIEEKASGIAFDCTIRVAAAARDATAIRDRLYVVAASLAPYRAANWFRLATSLRAAFDRAVRSTRVPLAGSFVLTASELAAVWHLPTEAPPQLEMRSVAEPAPAADIGGADDNRNLDWAKTCGGRTLGP